MVLGGVQFLMSEVPLYSSGRVGWQEKHSVKLQPARAPESAAAWRGVCLNISSASNDAFCAISHLDVEDRASGRRVGDVGRKRIVAIASGFRVSYMVPDSGNVVAARARMKCRGSICR